MFEDRDHSRGTPFFREDSTGENSVECIQQEWALGGIQVSQKLMCDFVRSRGAALALSEENPFQFVEGEVFLAERANVS